MKGVALVHHPLSCLVVEKIAHLSKKMVHLHQYVAVKDITRNEMTYPLKGEKRMRKVYAGLAPAINTYSPAQAPSHHIASHEHHNTLPTLSTQQCKNILNLIEARHAPHHKPPDVTDF